MRTRAPEATALQKGDLELLSKALSRNETLETSVLATLERIQPPPVPAGKWRRLLGAAHQIQKEQRQLAAEARSGHLAAVHNLVRTRSRQRAELGRIADAVHLAPCRDLG